jgi:cytochrome c2
MFPGACSLGVATLAIAGMVHAEAISVDSRRGEELFQELPCIRCHKINGKGGSKGPDLAKRLKSEYSPAGIAARMWNHAPKMWAALEEDGLAVQPIGDQAAADLFGYFYALRFIERGGDASKGEHLFQDEGCLRCHATDDSTKPAKRVAEWSSLGRPLDFAVAIWGHADDKIPRRAKLKGQEVADIVAYVRSLPNSPKQPFRLDTEKAAGGDLIETKGCTDCHKAKFDLARRLRTKTVNDMAAAMWNHTKVRDTPMLNEDEMQQVVGHLWTQQVLEPAGDVEAGREVFEGRCAACHSGSGIAPALVGRKGKVSASFIVSSLWTHGPKMLKRLKENNSEWPKFTTDQMADVIAFLNNGGR